MAFFWAIFLPDDDGERQRALIEGTAPKQLMTAAESELTKWANSHYLFGIRAAPNEKEGSCVWQADGGWDDAALQAYLNPPTE